MPGARQAARSAKLTGHTREALHRIDTALADLDERTFLCRMYGFHTPVERGLVAAVELDDVIADARLRTNKGALLSLDLLRHGVDRRELAAVPRMTVPELGDLAVALGWMYILETMTLAVRRRRAAGDASAYLRCYGKAAKTRWKELVAAIVG